MQKSVKNSLLLLTLIMVLIISISATFAQDVDDFANDLAVSNDYESISVETQNDGCATVSESVANDDENLGYPHSTSGSYIKFNQEDIVITEGESVTVTGTLLGPNDMSLAGGDFALYVYFDNTYKGMKDLYGHKLSYDVPSSWLTVSDTPHKLEFRPTEGEGDYEMFLEETGGAFMSDSWVQITVNPASTALTEVYVNYEFGDDSNTGTSDYDAFKTIAHALDVVEDNGIINVYGVNYLDDVDVNGIPINKNIAIVGDDGYGSIHATIDARNAGRIFKIGAYTVSLSNLIFVNGNASGTSEKRGGALYVDGATLTIDNCKFINDTASASGTYSGAVNLKSSSTTIKGTEFDGSTAWYAGAAINAENSNVLLDISDSVFTNNEILNNGWSTGAAICAYGTVNIDRTVFKGNKFADPTRNGRSINEYGTGSLTITNSVLLDGEKGVWIASGPTSIENNWWGNNDTTKDSNPKDLGYTNADVSAYCYLNLTNEGDTVAIQLLSTDGAVQNNIVDIPVTVSATSGTVDPAEFTLSGGYASVPFTPEGTQNSTITVDALGIQDSIVWSPTFDFTNVYVDYENGVDTNDGTSWETAVKTIEHALDIVDEDGTINVNGVNYLDDVDVNGIVINKNVAIVGNGMATIDARNAGRIFKIGAYIVSLSNLIFVNGNASGTSEKRGGALYVDGATLTIDNCKFINDTASASGTYSGAVNLKSSSTTIRNTEFDGCTAWYAGAAINAESNNVLLDISDSVFTNNEILNSGWSTGAAICAYGTVNIDRSIFMGNKFADPTKNGRSINEYGAGSLTITNSVLLDGEKSVWIASGPTSIEDNWWGNNETTMDTNPKDLGYTNADVRDYFWLAISTPTAPFETNTQTPIEIVLVSTGGTDPYFPDLPATVSSSQGTFDKDSFTLVNGEAIVQYTTSVIGENVITAEVLGVTDTIELTFEDGYIPGQVLPAMSEIDSGVVSGGADYAAVNPAATSGSLTYTIPEGMTDVQSAFVIVNIYSGSGAPTYGLISNVTLNTKNGLQQLGYERLWLNKDTANDANVYGVNDHSNKQYSDFQMTYDITDKVNNLESGDTITINVANSKYESHLFDGRIKLISLFFAYDDGDYDNYTYWLNAGQVWTSSNANFNINTRGYSGKTDNISFRTIALSSSIGSKYKINNVETNYDSYSSGGLTYKDIKWNNISSVFTSGSNTNFWFENGGASYKTNVALLVATEIYEPPIVSGDVYVDYENGLDTNDGSSSDNAVKTIAKALDLVADDGTIYIASNVNYLDDVDVNGLTISKNIAIVGVGNNIVIDARGASGIFRVTGQTVNFTNLVFANANVASTSDKRGGAIWANGAVLNIDACEFVNNTAGRSNSYGGAINMKGSSTATITSSYFENNTAWYGGGAINTEGSGDKLIINDSVFTNNGLLNSGWSSGGAVSGYGTFVVDNSLFYGNYLTDKTRNGATFNLYSGTLTITNSALLDGENSKNAVYSQTASNANVENNWWGNTATNKDTNPKDLGYTNANVNTYYYLNLTNNDNTISIDLLSNDGSAVDISDIPITVSVTDGTVNPTGLIMVNGHAEVTFTPGSSQTSTITVDALGIQESIVVSSEVLDYTNVYVDYENGSNANDGTSWGTAVKTIEKALTLVEDDGTIHVADGIVYLESSTPNEGIAITKNVAIVGQSLNATVSGNNAKRIFIVKPDYKLTIRNLTLTEGRIKTGRLSNDYVDCGGAIYVEDGGRDNPNFAGKLDIADSVVSNSRVDMLVGGGIAWYRAPSSGIAINNVSFIGNYAPDGGALANLNAVVLGDNNKFINNTAGKAGAIYSQAGITIGSNNYFEHNTATNSYGGVIYSTASSAINMGTGNVFVNNIAGPALITSQRSGTLTGSYEFFVNNTATRVFSAGSSSSLENCYWDTNDPDFTTLASGSFTPNAYLVLNIESDKDAIRVGESATITVELTNQNGGAIDVTKLPKDLPIKFTSTNGDVDVESTILDGNFATTEYTATMIGTGVVTAYLYNGNASVEINLLPPAGTIFVDYANGLDTNDGSDWDNAVKTIEYALSIVGDDRIIYVADGVNVFDDLAADGLTITKNISIVGVGDNVVLDANHAGRIFNIDGLTVNLSNLIFVNGNASNATDKRGGALYVKNATLNIDNCKFINNTVDVKSTYGGAINLKSSTTTITNSEFDGNSAWSTGAAINAENTNILLNISDTTFKNNVILNNGWSAGAAICSYNTVIIDRSVFYGNKLTDTTRNGKSINQYQTGSLTITNSILLDGEKGVWVATGPTTLENNWWGNNENNSDINPKDLGYTNADVGNYLVLTTTFDKVAHLGDTVAVTVALDQNVVELPLVLDVNLGEIDPNETTLINEVQATYTPVTTGDEVLTVNILGVEYEYPFVVKDEIINVAIDGITTQWADGVYPAVTNNFTVKVTNNDDREINNLTVELYSDETDELIATYTFDSIEKGTSTIVINDPTIRELTEQTVWPAAQDNIIKFTVNLVYDDEVVASRSVNKLLAYNGYLNKTYAYGGHDNIINRNYTISGDIIISTQDGSVYKDQYSRFRNETWNIETPEDAEIVKVFLYFNYNWDTSFFPNGWTLMFNDMDITSDYLTHETDRGNLGGWGAYNYGLLVFDVTDYYIANENNSFVINKTGNCALYPSTLFVLYNVTDSISQKDVYFSDICDVYYPYYNKVGYDDLLKHVVYYNGINVENVVEATWYAFAGSTSTNNNLAFNDGLVENAYAGRSSDDCLPYVYDVTDLIGENNEAWFISTTAATTTVGYEQVLVVERGEKTETSISVANDTVELAIGEEFDIGAVLTPAEAGNLTYSSDNESVAIVEDGKIIAVGSGNAVVTVSFGGSKFYLPSNATVAVTVPVVKSDVDMSVSAEVVKVGDDAYVDVVFNVTDVTGTVAIDVDGTEYSADISDGSATIIIPGLSAGEYTFEVVYSGDENYNNATAEVVVTVEKYAVDFTKAKGHPGRVDQNATIDVILSESDATGTVYITVNGTDYSAELVDGKAVIYAPLLPAGTYNFDVIYSGDGKYENNTAPITFNVNKYYPTMKATAASVRMDENATVNVVLPSDATGTVTITVDGVDYTADVVDGTASVVLPIISEEGLQTFDVVYSGDGKYRTQTTNVEFNVLKYNANIKATARTVKLGNNVTVNVVLPSDATGEVSIDINGTVYTGTVEDGAASIILPDLGVGQYALTVDYTGDEKYKPANTTVTFNVNKQTTSIKATARTVKVGDNVTVNVALASDATGEVIINVDGVNYTATVENGAATIVIPDLPYGQYALEVQYSGDDKYKARTTTVTFNVNKQTTTMKATARTVKVGDNVTVNVALASDVTGDVIISVDGVNYTATVENGVASIVIPDLPAGQYALDVKYGGDDKYKNQSTTVKFNVNKYNVRMKATAKYYEDGGFAMVSVTLSDDATGSVSVEVNGNNYTASVANAKALIAIPDLAAGEYTLGVVYSGDAKYNNYTSTVNLEVTA